MKAVVCMYFYCDGRDMLTVMPKIRGLSSALGSYFCIILLYWMYVWMYVWMDEDVVRRKGHTEGDV